MRPIGLETVTKHLRFAARNAGVELTGQTAKSFRHTLNTEQALIYPWGSLQRLMGHKTDKETVHYTYPDRRWLIIQAVNAHSTKIK